MRFPLRAPLALAAGLATFAAAAPAMANPATVAWDNGSDTTSTINQGEAVTWDVQGSGHNIDVFQGPETFRSTSGKDAVGTQFSHAFSKPGTYKFICDYHSSMKGTITVLAAPSQPAAGQPAAQPAAGAPAASGNSSQAVSGPAGPVTAGIAGVDAAAPTVSKPAFRKNVLRLRLSEASKLTVRYVKTGKAHTVASRKLTAKKGLNTFSVRRWMRPGSYRVSIVAVDAAGNASKPARLKLTVRR
jgi:plastocyanin